MRKVLSFIVPVLCLFLASQPYAKAQFKEDAFTQSYADTTVAGKDSTDTMFSLKEYFGGVFHKRDARIGTLFAGSTLFVGGYQAYNRDYWKIPVIYGGIGTAVGLGIHWKDSKPDLSTAMFIGAGAIWWASLLDGAACYNPGSYPQPGKATIYSILVPGLGQIYNKEYWKVPIYWTGIIGSIHYLTTNSKNYKRYRNIYNQAAGEHSDEYDGPISAETALYFRNYFRRMRDYSYLALAGFYLLQVIDANVFAYMYDFNMDDDIALKVSPALVSTDQTYALRPDTYGYGLKIGLRF